MKTYLKNRASLFNQSAFSRYFIGVILARIGGCFIYIGNIWFVISLYHDLSSVIWSFLAYMLPRVNFIAVCWHSGRSYGKKVLNWFGDYSYGINPWLLWPILKL